MVDEIDAMGAMLNSSLSFARDDAKRKPHTLVDFDALRRACVRTPRKLALR